MRINNKEKVKPYSIDCSDEKAMWFLNLSEELRKKTRYWREIVLIYGLIKLPMELIALTELQSTIGIFQGIVNILITFGVLFVASWLIILKRIKMKRGEFVI